MSYIVAVRALCEFTARQGDLDLRFTPAPSALEGIAGHATVAARRPRHYESEVSLKLDYKQLHVRGRADGYDSRLNRIEEVKTYRGDLHKMPANHRHLHWAQAKIYAWMLCATRALQDIDIALVYFDIGSQKETLLIEHWTADALREYFEQQCTRFLAWAEQELRHRQARNVAWQALQFPYADFRDGQRHLAESVYKAAISRRCLMAQAPTGIGKTVGTLFPLLKAAPAQGIDKVFFLAAKTSGRSLALDGIAQLRNRNADAPAPMRVLELVARDKACEHPDKACHGDSCPLASGFYDRVADARAEAVNAATLDRATIRTIALGHQVCPYYLSQELVRWSDVVVGDYNYYFDTSAMLYSLTLENEWRVGLLVDEAHNMVERARAMYSAELDQSRFRFARKAAPKNLKGALDRVHRLWNELHSDQHIAYQVYHAIPSKFLFALQQANTEITDFMAEQADALHEDLQRFYFDALHFVRLAETFGEHTLFDISKDTASHPHANAVLTLRNVVPAPFLKTRFAAAHTATLFSATLAPHDFYADLLGLPDDVVLIDVESPFAAQQLSVHIARDISTRYQHREQSLSSIVELIAAQHAQRPGNYLAFFSSFDYLQKVWDVFVAHHSHVPAWRQEKRMDEAARTQFLERFAVDGSGIGFAVLGGAFAEGIDLPGSRLIGAFVATLGLPQVNVINDEMRDCMENMFGNGYNYTYLYPGLQKVVQAAGRVIRTTDDRGVVHLIDDRFARNDVRRLLPRWWKIN